MPLPSFVISASLNLLFLAAVVGCAESSEDLFKKHANRSRSVASPEEAVEKHAPDLAAKKQAGNVRVADNLDDQSAGSKRGSERVQAHSASSTAGPHSVTSPVNASASETVSSGLAVSGTKRGALKKSSVEDLSERVGIKPVALRKPEAELTVAERRRRSYENLMKINEAFLAYLDRNQKFPRAYQVNAGGIPTLSWRVELLPYLGYRELYEEFDLTRGWDMSPNKQLLQFIPDEYLSPDRFDDKTNYLLPTESTFVFGDNRALAPQYIDDGPENTLMLLEVNDSRAVSWTEPTDFQPTYGEDLASYLGKLRADGTFALWANGYPVLLESGLSNAQLYSALTFRKGEGLRAADIHRKITFGKAEEDPDTGQSLLGDLADEADSDISESIGGPGYLLSAPLTQEVSFQRGSVPAKSDIQSAQQRLRVIFRDKLGAADCPADKAALATELLKAADEIQTDEPGVYVLQQAALHLAVAAGDAAVLIQGIDKRVAKFEVDSFKENLKWIQAFGESTSSRDSGSVKAGDLLKRSVPVIYAGIREDEYMFASSVARIAGRHVGKDRNDRVGRLLTRLRSQLGSAKREYDKSVANLERFRSDPEDAAAGASFGMFLCFIKGDWQTGLPLVAEGGAGDLAELAAMDLRGAGRSVDQIAIGDAWWELSQRGAGVYRQGAQDRAVMWYQTALERLPESLDRIHVRHRLKEAGEVDGRSPIALCLQMADELGIDLSASLTSIAVSGGRGGRHVAEDDD